MLFLRRGNRGLAVACAAIAVALCAASTASAQDPYLAVDGRTNSGYISFYVAGEPNTTARIGEVMGGSYQPIADVQVPATGGRRFERLATWRCGNPERTFAALIKSPGGTYVERRVSVLFPSCRDRLAVTAPRTARNGTRVRVGVADRWTLGGFSARVCLTPPKGRRRCRTLQLQGGETERASFRVRRPGKWRVSVKTSFVREKSTLRVGKKGKPAPGTPVLLSVGDSLVQNLDAALADRLRGRVIAESSVHPASGIAKPLVVDFPALARRQARRLKPKVTVIMLGANDSFDMRTPAGEIVKCCDDPWILEYSRRAESMMRSYGRRGRGRVYWALLPAPGDQRYLKFWPAVNTAIRAAAAGRSNVQLIGTGSIVSPGGTYVESLPGPNGPQRVRERDGIHLSPYGADLVAQAIIALLENDRVL